LEFLVPLRSALFDFGGFGRPLRELALIAAVRSDLAVSQHLGADSGVRFEEGFGARFALTST
jgi:hypothetical protein